MVTRVLKYSSNTIWYWLNATGKVGRRAWKKDIKRFEDASGLKFKYTKLIAKREYTNTIFFIFKLIDPRKFLIFRLKHAEF